MKSFCEWLLENNLEKAYRYEHDDGSGLMNNSSLNYDKLTDDEYNICSTTSLNESSLKNLILSGLLLLVHLTVAIPERP